MLIEGADGRTMLARTVDHVLASKARPVLVVTGHRDAEIRACLKGRDVVFVPSPRYQEGLAESLKAGLAALPDESAAFLVCLGDMPLVTGMALDQVMAAYDADEGRLIVVPTHGARAAIPCCGTDVSHRTSWRCPATAERKRCSGGMARWWRRSR